MFQHLDKLVGGLEHLLFFHWECLIIPSDESTIFLKTTKQYRFVRCFNIHIYPIFSYSVYPTLSFPVLF